MSGPQEVSVGVYSGGHAIDRVSRDLWHEYSGGWDRLLITEATWPIPVTTGLSAISGSEFNPLLMETGWALGGIWHVHLVGWDTSMLFWWSSAGLCTLPFLFSRAARSTGAICPALPFLPPPWLCSVFPSDTSLFWTRSGCCCRCLQCVGPLSGRWYGVWHCCICDAGCSQHLQRVDTYYKLRYNINTT